MIKNVAKTITQKKKLYIAIKRKIKLKVLPKFFDFFYWIFLIRHLFYDFNFGNHFILDILT